LLFVAGAAMVLLAIIVDPIDTVALSLVGFGSTLMALGALLPRLVGRLRFSVQGLEAQLVSVVEAAAIARGFSETTTQKAVEIAASETSGNLQGWIVDLLAEAAREAPGPLASLDSGQLRDAMQDPLVRALFVDARRVASRQKHESSHHD
jgi:hypothetical protein